MPRLAWIHTARTRDASWAGHLRILTIGQGSSWLASVQLHDGPAPAIDLADPPAEFTLAQPETAFRFLGASEAEAVVRAQQWIDQFYELPDDA